MGEPLKDEAGKAEPAVSVGDETKFNETLKRMLTSPPQPRVPAKKKAPANKPKAAKKQAQ